MKFIYNNINFSFKTMRFQLLLILSLLFVICPNITKAASTSAQYSLNVGYGNCKDHNMPYTYTFTFTDDWQNSSYYFSGNYSCCDEHDSYNSTSLIFEVNCDGTWMSSSSAASRGCITSRYEAGDNDDRHENGAWYQDWNITTATGRVSAFRAKATNRSFERFNTYTATRYYEDIKKDATASAANKTYNGSAQTGVTGANVNWSGTTSATNAGTYTAYATPQSKHAWSDGSTSTRTITWTISRSNSASASAANKTYNGSSQTGVTGSNVSWSGTTSATNAGSYTAYATPTSNYAWSDGSTGQRTITWTMNKKALSGTLTVGVNTSGVASWNAITGAANYTVKIGNSTINTTTSTSYDLKSSLVSSAGSKTVTIIANPNSNYSGSISGSSGVNIYTLTQKDNAGTHTSTHISGSTATIRTPAAKTGYTFQYWQKK